MTSTYLPKNIFSNILTFCDDRIERNAKINHQKTMAVINHIRLATELQDKLRSKIYRWSCNERLPPSISPDLSLVYNGGDCLIEDILKFLVGKNINLDNDKLIMLISIVFDIE